MNPDNVREARIIHRSFLIPSAEIPVALVLSECEGLPRSRLLMNVLEIRDGLSPGARG